MILKTHRFKAWISLLVCVVGVVYSLPNFLSPEYQRKMPSWLATQTINLGLDLQGGSHLLMEVGINDGLKDRMAFVMDGVRKSLRAGKIGYQKLGLSDDKMSVLFELRDQNQGDAAISAIRSLDADVAVSVGAHGAISVSFTDAALKERRAKIVSQSIEIIRRRIDELGTKEPVIQRQGDDRILIQLPGMDNPGHVKSLLGKTAKMSFHLVDDTHPYVDSMTSPAPSGTLIVPGDERENGKIIYYAVRKEALLGGENLVDAGVNFDEYQRPQVSFRFDSVGARRFGDLTANNVGRLLAIVLDGKVISAPSIRGAIPGGSGVITGRFDLKEANDLALLMRAGALVAPLTVLEERTVGPELGADSIHAGRYATIVAILMVAIFMFIAYALFGVFANVAMLINLILLIACLTAIGATLTLPGIAGIALTMGMAVDANVLINERIKEELRLGRKLASAIDSGYNRAMATIIDSNITTLIGAMALFFFGTGPVKGFGITLSIGILVSMFTAITLTRVLVGAWINWRKPKTLSI